MEIFYFKNLLLTCKSHTELFTQMVNLQLDGFSQNKHTFMVSLQIKNNGIYQHLRNFLLHPASHYPLKKIATTCFSTPLINLAWYWTPHKLNPTLGKLLCLLFKNKNKTPLNIIFMQFIHIFGFSNNKLLYNMLWYECGTWLSIFCWVFVLAIMRLWRFLHMSFDEHLHAFIK